MGTRSVVINKMRTEGGEEKEEEEEAEVEELGWANHQRKKT